MEISKITEISEIRDKIKMKKRSQLPFNLCIANLQAAQQKYAIDGLVHGMPLFGIRIRHLRDGLAQFLIRRLRVQVPPLVLSCK